jgi:plasmid stabilization system protein ParE
MSFSITWMPEAFKTFDDRMDYLKIHWTDKEIIKFQNRVKEYLDLLKDEPYIGKKAGKVRNVYVGLIIKPVSLIYRVKPLNKEIELLLFVDNRQDPKKIRKYTT